MGITGNTKIIYEYSGERTVKMEEKALTKLKELVNGLNLKDDYTVVLIVPDKTNKKRMTSGIVGTSDLNNLLVLNRLITDATKERILNLASAVASNKGIKNCDLGGYYGKRNTTDRGSKDGRKRRNTGKKDR